MAFAEQKEVGDLVNCAKVFHVDVLERQSGSNGALQKTDDVNDAEAVDSALFKQERRALKLWVAGCVRMDHRQLGIDVVE
jgi:hypothetical protein